MDNPGLPNDLWLQIDGRLWHATNRDGLRGIIADGEIRVDVGNRYRSSFCRQRAAICLFDFGPNSEDVENQFHNWCGWFGRQQEARVAVWLEIDREHVQERLLDAGAAREAWKKIRCHTFIPGVEACHSGPIPIMAVAGALLVDQHNRNLFRRLDRVDDNTTQDIDAFEETLPAHQVDPVVEALLAGRQRIVTEAIMKDQDKISASEIARHAVALVNRHGKHVSRPTNDGPPLATVEIGPTREFYVKREGNDVLVFREGKKAFGARLNRGWDKDDSKILEHDDSIKLGKSWASRFLDED